MARSSKVEACIFCGDIPCTCNKPAKSSRPSKKAEKAASNSKSRFKGSVKAKPAPVAPPPEQPSSRFEAPVHEAQVETQEELELKQAIRNLEPLLAPAEKNRHRSILNPITAATERRLVEWRKRHAKS